MTETALVRDKSSVVSTDESGFAAYQNQRRLMLLKQSSDSLVMTEINKLKHEINDLRTIVEQLMIKVNDV
jgi:nitrogen-specific signal transduction histidine kinase